MDQTIRTFSALTVIILGIVVAFLKFQLFRSCPHKYRWIFGLEGISGLLSSVIFGQALVHFYAFGGSDGINPIFGRPLFILVLTSLVLNAIYNHKIEGEC